MKLKEKKQLNRAIGILEGVASCITPSAAAVLLQVVQILEDILAREKDM